MQWQPLPEHWTRYFFYPILPLHCPLCALPRPRGEWCADCAGLQSAARPSSGVFFSYTWGHSKSPAYAFKNIKNFDEGLRQQIKKSFVRVVSAGFSKLQNDAYVVSVPPRASLQRRPDDHLDQLLAALEQLGFQVLRQMVAFKHNARKPCSIDDLEVPDDQCAQKLEGARVILLNNVWVTGNTARRVSEKLFEWGAAEVHLCILARWLGDFAKQCDAQRYRDEVCPQTSYIHRWYHEQHFRHAMLGT